MNNLLNYRLKIDEIDDEIIKLLKKRFLVVKDIKKFKQDNNLPVLDKMREDIINLKIKKQSAQFFKEIDLIYQTILKVSKDLQNE